VVDMDGSITVSAPGRIDLSGGATDWCGMQTLAMAINLRAYATVKKIDNPNKKIITIGDNRIEYEKPEYDGNLNLFKAVIELTGQSGFEVNYKTDIPKGSGLGGSAPLTVATVMAVSKLFGLNWSRYYMAELAQRAESLKLQTVNGYQDQYSAMFGGLLYMDFNGKSCQKWCYSKPIDQEPYTTVEVLTEYAPIFNVVVAVPEIIRSSSNETNGSVSERYLNGEKLIVELMKKKAMLTQEAKKAVVDGKINKLYDLINQNNEIMRSFGYVSEDDEKIITIGIQNGAVACKTCGAGRGAVAILAKSAESREKIYRALENRVKDIFKVEMDTGARFE